MTKEESILSRLQEMIRRSNEITGRNDCDLTECIETLTCGFGGIVPYGYIREDTILVTQDYMTDDTGNAQTLNELFVPGYQNTADFIMYLLYFTNNNTSDWKACCALHTQRLNETSIISINWRNRWKDANSSCVSTRGLHVAAGTIIHRIQFITGDRP